MRLNEVDEDAIREFIDAFREGGQAPEAYQKCPNDSDEDFDPPASPAPSPGASPGADATPAPDASPSGRRGGSEAEETEAPG
jgi:hypothetical protein